MKKYIKYLLLALFIFSFSSVALAEGEVYKGFTTSKLVIRDLEGNQVGLIDKGEEVAGKIKGNWLHFTRNDQEVKIYKPYVRSEKIMLNRLSNFRDQASKNGAVVFTKAVGSYLSVDKAQDNSNWYEYTSPDGKLTYVYKTNALDNLVWKEGFFSSYTNVRNAKDNSIVRVEKKANPVSGYVIGNWLYLVDGIPSGVDSIRVYLPLVVDQKPSLEVPIKGFTKGNVNVRKAMNYNNSSKLRVTPGSVYIEGVKIANGKWIRFKNYGQTAYISSSVFEELSANTKSTWVTRGSNKFYVNSKNNVLRGWRSLNKSYYYFDPEYRYMYKGVKNTGPNIHYFKSDGKVSSGKRTIYGTKDTQTLRFYGPTKYDLSNKHLNSNPSVFLQQAAVNESIKAIGTKYYWYGTNLKNGVYCSGLSYRAYKNVGITIPGPEHGNEAQAKKLGPRSGPAKRGWGPVGDYGYMMVVAQIDQTHKYTSGKRFAWNSNFSELIPGDLIFGRRPEKSHLSATHTMIYAGKINGIHYIMHSGFAGTFLDPISVVRDGWGYPIMPYAQRPIAFR